jgi:LysM repeat protein
MGTNVGTARLFRNASLGLLVAGTAAAAVAPAEARSETGGREQPGTESPSTQPIDVHKATEQALRKVAIARVTSGLTPAVGAARTTTATTSVRTPAAKSTAPHSTGSGAKAAARTYTVRRGDTLASIAQSQLGNERLWPAIFAHNRDREQPDGGRLTDPDLLRTGWTLELAVGHSAEGTHLVALRSTTAQTAVEAGRTQPRHRQSPHTATVKTRSEGAGAAFRGTTTGGSAQTIAESIVPSGQFGCFSEIISHESGWNVHAVNPGSGAYGLAQALPGWKMASAGSDWRNDATTQIRWALDYMDSRYGSPCDAWNFWQDHRWY